MMELSVVRVQFSDVARSSRGAWNALYCVAVGAPGRAPVPVGLFSVLSEYSERSLKSLETLEPLTTLTPPLPSLAHSLEDGPHARKLLPARASSKFSRGLSAAIPTESEQKENVSRQGIISEPLFFHSGQYEIINLTAYICEIKKGSIVHDAPL